MSKTTVIAEPGKNEIIATREFNAPRQLVFKISTDPKLIPQWWGPKYLTTTVEKMDVKFGGVWRYVQQDPDKNVYAFKGVYHVVVPGEQVVRTFEYEGVPGHVLLETTIFEEHDGKTRLTTKSVFQSVEDRDGMLQAGMEGGQAESHDRLEALIAAAVPA